MFRPLINVHLAPCPLNKVVNFCKTLICSCFFVIVLHAKAHSRVVIKESDFLSPTQILSMIMSFSLLYFSIVVKTPWGYHERKKKRQDTLCISHASTFLLMSAKTKATQSKFSWQVNLVRSFCISITDAIVGACSATKNKSWPRRVTGLCSEWWNGERQNQESTAVFSAVYYWMCAAPARSTTPAALVLPSTLHLCPFSVPLWDQRHIRA